MEQMFAVGEECSLLHVCGKDSLTCLTKTCHFSTLAYCVFLFLFLSGNCWLLAALSCLTMHPTLFVKVVPPGQSLSEPYAGIFRFRVSKVGRNVQQRTSDMLPFVVNDKSC